MSGREAKGSEWPSDETVCDADVRIRDVKPVPLDVVQAVVTVQPGRGRAISGEVQRLERDPRSELRREVGTRRVTRTAEDATGASEDMDEHTRRLAPPKASSSPSEADRQLPHLVRPNDRAIRSHSSGLSWFRMSFVRVLSQNAIANWFETGPRNEVQGASEASKKHIQENGEHERQSIPGPPQAQCRQNPGPVPGPSDAAQTSG